VCLVNRSGIELVGRAGFLCLGGNSDGPCDAMFVVVAVVVVVVAAAALGVYPVGSILSTLE
jgi:hypothetical protein